ncbi:hypothetical protein V7S43_011268 [Phytophthora oleae]|uniref:RxLR effector protein n=1 Tax=Phytophthora oleae TaxID=2107226 RepID=A0ABD3FC30_9STRA
MVFTLLKTKLGDKVSKPLAVVEARHLIRFTDSKKIQEQSARIEGFTMIGIEDAYTLPEVTPDVGEDVATGTIAALIKKFGIKERTRTALTRDEVEQLQKAFTETEYMGDAHVKFGQYLRQCYEAYNPDQFKAPYVTVMQSSGFGKSRMLLELAKDTKDLNMKVLYTCMRETKSTGYPESTRKLRKWLFKEDSDVRDISGRLKAGYYYAIENWALSRSNEWSYLPKRVLMLMWQIR